MPSASSLLSAIGSYACEKHFPDTLDAIMKENFYYVEEKPRLFFELRAHASNLKIENTTKIVKLMERIKSSNITIFAGEINTLLYFAKVLDVLSILKSTEPSSLDVMTILNFRNTVDCYFPERYPSVNDENVKLYGIMRNIFLKISLSTISLKQFCENELEKRWKKFVENFCENALSFVIRGFKHIEECNNTEIEGLKIHEHQWWKEFQQHYPTQQQHENDETYKTFVDFIQDKVAKNRRKTYGTTSTS